MLARKYTGITDGPSLPIFGINDFKLVEGDTEQAVLSQIKKDENQSIVVQSGRS